MSKLKATNARRSVRVRLQVKRAANGRPRLSVFRSSKHIYAQVIDDVKGETLASASTMEKIGAWWRQDGCRHCGCDRCRQAPCRACDQGWRQGSRLRPWPYLYHGRVKALADAAREGGLSF
jgi:large subunit ribosomal protein L18